VLYCAYGIEKKIKALAGVAKESVEIRLNDGGGAFEASTDNPIDEATLKQLVNEAGFTLRSLNTQPLTQEDTHNGCVKAESVILSVAEHTDGILCCL
jgi:copper chaperone CopZ